MLVIWKFNVEPGQFSHELPRSAQVLSVHMQSGSAFMWVLLDPDYPKTMRTFHVVGTGQRVVELDMFIFIGTFLMENDSLVWHLFEERP